MEKIRDKLVYFLESISLFHAAADVALLLVVVSLAPDFVNGGGHLGICKLETDLARARRHRRLHPRNGVDNRSALLPLAPRLSYPAFTGRCI